MPELNFNILDGLSFNERNSTGERLLDATFVGRQGVLSARRAHSEKFSVAGVPRRLLSFADHASIYTLDEDGNLYANASLLSTGFSSVDGTLLSALPNNNVADQYLFIAGGSQMRKYDGTTLTQWGIDPPPDDALTAASAGIVGTNTLSDCENVSDWSEVDCVIADDSTIVVSGTNSMKVSLTAGLPATITHNFMSAQDLSIPTVVSFYLQATNASAIRSFEMQFDLVGDGFINNIAHRTWGVEFSPGNPASVGEIANSTVPQSESGESDSELSDRSMTRVSTLPATNDLWKHIIVGRETFQIDAQTGWSTVYSFRFRLLSDVDQDLHFDIIYMTTPQQDDVQGARYKYAYENSVTGHHSNLNLDPTDRVRGENSTIEVTGFAQPTDPQVDTIRVFRDVGGDGNYFSVGTLAVPDPWSAPTFNDAIPIASLGDLDTNDNAPPQPATLAIEYAEAIWLNDISNDRRLWRTTAGRNESISLSAGSGFFDVGISINGFGIIASTLYVLGADGIVSVLTPTLTPVFRRIRNIGPVHSRAFAFTQDYAVIVHWTGMYLFDGATLTPVASINSLFNSESTDSRRINATNIDTVIVGASNTHIWLSYTDLAGTRRQYVYAISERKWTEESDVLVAHDSADETFYQIAANEAGTVYDLYASASFLPMTIRTDIAELVRFNSFLGANTPDSRGSKTIGHLRDFAIELLCASDVTVTAYADEVAVASEIFSTATRAWKFITLIDVLADRCELEFTCPAVECEIYSIVVRYNQLLDTSHFRSEPISLANDLAAVSEFNVHLIGLADGSVTVTLEVDGLQIIERVLEFTRNQLVVRRQTVYPRAGKTAELDISGTRFALRTVTLGTTQLSDGKQTYVSIPLENVR